jgi:aminoglycoside phosphotransferase (APT) family kinase protein
VSRAVEFNRKRPSAETLRWVEKVLGPGARVVAWRRMTGGIISAVHRLTIDRGGRRVSLVLRQYAAGPPDHPDLVRQEAATLGGVGAAGLPAPEVVAFCADGAEAGGCPSLLMSRLPGRVWLAPEDRADWLGQIARAAAKIHEANVTAPAFQSWIDNDDLVVPASATRPAVWQAAFAVLRQPASPVTTRFIHRDFQHFNFLWHRGRLTGVVDWAVASTGPPDVDAGHCRLNLAVLFGADWAEEFRLAYEAETGRPVDPWWDLHAIASYGDGWPEFIPVQVAGRVPVDTAGMTARIEELLEGTLRRL